MLLAGICILLVIPDYACPAPVQKVLILNSYHKEFKWTDAQVNAAKEVLSKGAGTFELFVEYMDTKRRFNKEILEALFNLYRLKYKNIAFDVIITTDDNALWFVEKYHKVLFGEAPVCFCGINDYKASLLRGKKQFTGLVEVLDIKVTIDLILKLHPGTRKIVVVVDSTPTGSGQLKDITAVAEKYPNLTFEYLEGRNLSHAELFRKLQSLSADTVVLLAVWLRDKHHTYLSSEEGGRLISQNASVPVYGIVDMYFGNGIVGGKLLSSKSHGRLAAQKALQIMKGEKASDLPTIHESVNPYMFDYQQLQRWKIKLSDLPEGSFIINKPFSFYTAYKKEIWIVSGLFLFLILTILFLALNILRRRHAEAALRESEEKYRTLLETITDMVFIVNTEGNFVYLNPEFEKITGFSSLELIGYPFTEHLAPEYVASTVDRFKRGLSGEAIPPYEVAFQRKDGKTVPVDLKVTSLPDINGKMVGRIGVARDISEREEARRALNKSESEKKAILDGITTNIRFVDKDLKILWANKASIISADKSYEEMIGHKCYEFWGNRKQACSDCPSIKTFNEKKTNRSTRHSPDGKIWDLKTEPVFDHTEELVGVVEIAHDITDQSRLADQLDRARKMEAIGIVAGGVAHDLNNILAGLVSYPELLLMQLPEDSPFKNSILTIQRSGEKAAAIVQDMLTLARRGVVVADVININDIISEYLKSPEYDKLQSYHPHVLLETHLEKDVLNILGSSTHLSKTIMNLVSNAAEAMSDGGEITICTENRYIDRPIRGYDDVKEGDYAVLTIIDTGSGIPPEDIKHIFEAFYTKKKMGRSGTGLGMAVVWGTVKDHKGYVDVKSIVGKGTTFTLYFPVTREELPEDTATVTFEAYCGNGETILIVDDVEEQRRIATGMLKALGYSVESVPCGEAAVEYLKGNKVDLLLLDMIMDPGMDGLETYRKILQIHPGQKAVIASGFSESHRVKEVQRLGAGSYVKKPLMMEKLGFAVRAELEKRKEI